MSEASSRQTALATGANDHERVERSSTHAGSLLYRIVMSQQFAIVLVITVFVIFGATQSDQFLRTGTWINILRNAASNELPEDQRTVVALVLIDGMSYRDAADTLGLPIGTVTSRLARAREALAARVFGAGAKPAEVMQ